MRITSYFFSIISTILSLVAIAAADSGDNPAIYTVVDASTNILELSYTLGTLHHASGYPSAPVFIFFGVVLSNEIQQALQSATTRPVTFVDIVAYYQNVPSIVSITPGTDYDYVQKQRFLTTHVWYEPSLEPYNVLMRITDTTCLTFDSDYLPGFPPSAQTLNYKSYSIPNSLELTKYTVGLYPKTLSYISANAISPMNVQLWVGIVNSHDHENKIPKFSDDFEIVRKSWVTSPEVQAYHEYLADKITVKDFFERKWTSSCVMYMTVALFSDEANTSTLHLPGIVEKDLWAGNYFPNLCRVTG